MKIQDWKNNKQNKWKVHYIENGFLSGPTKKDKNHAVSKLGWETEL